MTTPPLARGRRGGVAILVPLIVPFLSLDLGQEDIGATPKATTERQAYDLMAAGFGVGYNGPLLVAVEVGTPAPAEQRLREARSSRPRNCRQQLEQEQAQGESEQQQLTEQADALTRPQDAAGAAAERASSSSRATLESEQASLERQANAARQRSRVRAPGDERPPSGKAGNA